MKWITVLTFVTFLSVLTSRTAFAHPGNTAADGCHYCRTNCAKWGEIEGVRHCHGGGIIEPVHPNATTRPVLATTKPVATVTPIPTPTKTTEPSPEVESSSIESVPSPTPLVESAATENTLAGMVVFAALIGGGYLGLKWLGRVTAPKDDEIKA